MQFKIGLDDRLSTGSLLVYGLQWLMICIPVVVTSSFIAPEGQTVLYTQKMFGIMGLTMVVQILFGHRMPLVAGPAAALLMCVIAAVGQGTEPEATYPSMIVGGIIISVIAISGLIDRLRVLFTPRVIVSILILLSITTTKPIVGMIFSDSNTALALSFAIVCAVLMAVLNHVLSGIWKSSVVILAMILGSLFYYSVTSFPTDFVKDSVEGSLFLTPMKFDAGMILAFIFCYIALFINEVSSIEALGEFIEADGMPKRNRLGTFITGIMNVAAGACGVLGPVDYSLSPGLVASTQCASRHAVLPAAAAMVVLAFLPQAVSVLLTIPMPVMGMVLMYLMATQIAAGLNLSVAASATVTFRDGMIIGIPLLVDIVLSFAPAGALDAIHPLLRPIVGNGFVMGVIIVLLMEHVFLRERKNG